MGMYVNQRYQQGFRWKRPKNLKNPIIFGLGCFSIILFFAGARLIKSNPNSSSYSPQLFEVAPPDAFETPASLLDNFYATRVRVYDEILPRESLYTALRRLQVNTAMADKFCAALGKTVNLKLLLPGDALMVERSSPSTQLAGLSILGSPPSSLETAAIELFSKDESGVAYKIRAELAETAEGQDPTIDVSVIRPTVYKKHALINGMVTNNIYGAILNNDGDAQLVNNFSDIFAWQFDFYRDTREGDSYQMIVEENVSEGRFVGYGKVLAAEYSSGGKTLRGFYFQSNDGQIAGFFDGDGKSLKNAFLKAPLKIASITSGFNKHRFHPVQKRFKAHNGVDYGANRGTPFMAVASGTVINAGYSPFNGNWVRIQHANGYQTEYLHATHLAKGVRTGARVTQGQVIGYVGRTGLATGYHLHFGMKHHGQYVNPASQRFERSVGVPPKYMAEYVQSIEAMVIAFNRQAPERQVLAINRHE